MEVDGLNETRHQVMLEMWRNEGEGAAKQTIKLEINPFSQLSIGVLETISIADQR